MLVLFTDTDTDITPVEAKKYGYHLISMPYIIDEKEIFPYVDYEEFDAHEYYDKLRNGLLPKTTAISPLQYVEYFEPYFKNGDDILYVHFSKAMSGTFNAMNLALEELKEKYPERKFYTIDTKGISTLGLIVVKEVGKLYKEGKSIEEILEWAKNEVDHYAFYFYADNVKFFQRSGRVSGIAGFFANLLNIHPIIFIDTDGQMKTCSKENGRNKSLSRIISYMEKLGDHIGDYPIIIGHSDIPEVANKLKEMILEKFGKDLKIEMVVCNPTAGAHSGPDGVGVAFHAINRK